MSARCHGSFHGDTPSYFELNDRFTPGQLFVVLEQDAGMISVVPVELPDGGVLDVVDHFMETFSKLRGE